MDKKITAPRLSWEAAGSPAPNKRFKVVSTVGADSVCATCGGEAEGEAVTVASIDNNAFSERHESFKYKSSHVCMACAWLYGAGPSKPGNFFSTHEHFEQTVISLESVVADKRPWLHVLRDAALLPSDTACTGVLTTDVKPRLWPRARLASIGSFGLFVHAPDYDTSQWVSFCLHELLEIVDIAIPALQLGFAKASLYHGLLRDYQHFQKKPDSALEIELSIKPFRKSAAFLPAILVAGITKEDLKNDSNKPTDRNSEPATKRRDQDSQAQLGLL